MSPIKFGSVERLLACGPKGPGSNSPQGHIPELQVAGSSLAWILARPHAGGSQCMYLPHITIALCLTFSLSISQKINEKKSLDEDK